VRTIRVKVTAAHIASVAAAGYGPKIIAAALHDRLIDGVYIYVRCCWLMLGGRGGRIHIHLPLNLLPYTDRFSREKLLQEMTFTITLPRELVRGRPRAPRAPRP
jgi:hypothetical protein